MTEECEIIDHMESMMGVKEKFCKAHQQELVKGTDCTPVEKETAK